jgi:hypothetical protein
VRCGDADSRGHDEERRYSGPERRGNAAVADVAPVRLKHKYAEVIDGVDLSEYDVGDRVPLPPGDAKVLLAEGWAEPAPARERRGGRGSWKGSR